MQLADPLRLLLRGGSILLLKRAIGNLETRQCLDTDTKDGEQNKGDNNSHEDS